MKIDGGWRHRFTIENSKEYNLKNSKAQENERKKKERSNESKCEQNYKKL